MKKCILVALYSLLLISSLKAQITLNATDYPQTVVSVHSLQDTSSVITPGNAGTAQTWDFSTFSNGDTATVVTDYTVNNANPLYPGANSTPCNTFPPFNTYCNFLEFTPAGLYFHGTYAEMNQGSLVKMWSMSVPKQPDMVFPFTYNSTDLSSYVLSQLNTYTPAVGGYDSVRFVYHRTQKIEADGWGTVITPFGTYNALRVKRTQTNLDTTFNHTAGGAWSQGSVSALDTTIMYSWIANGVNVVAHLSNYTSPPGNKWRYAFYKTSYPTGINESSHEIEFACFPNPAQNSIMLQWSANATRPGSIEIFDILGRCVLSENSIQNNQIISLKGLSSGTYVVRLNLEGKWGHQKLSIR